MSTLIVDIQFGNLGEEEVCVREFAAIEWKENSDPSLLLFKPPIPWVELSGREKKSNLYLEENHHGIRWTDGFYEGKEVYRVLDKILVRANIVLTKGKEKEIYLRRYVKNVINIEDADENCPSLKKLQETYKQGYNCWNHTSPKSICACDNILNLFEYMNEQNTTLQKLVEADQTAEKMYNYVIYENQERKERKKKIELENQVSKYRALTIHLRQKITSVIREIEQGHNDQEPKENETPFADEWQYC